jgi:hypothetical protein
MGVPKKSRKGKKAWRKNIDATEVCMAAAGAVGLLGVLHTESCMRPRDALKWGAESACML